MKKIKANYIEKLENMDFPVLQEQMEARGSRGEIDVVNWPESFPYAPEVHFHIARSSSHIFLMYSVRGLDLRAVNLEDQGSVWEDSCCEFFVSDPQDGTYYNFEMNCIGTVLATKRHSRNDFVPFDADKLSRIIRFSSLERKIYKENGREFSWKTAIGIPMDLIGLDADHLPDTIKANVYKCADKTEHMHFTSWNPVAVPAPDFHRPDHFGEIEL